MGLWAREAFSRKYGPEQCQRVESIGFTIGKRAPQENRPRFRNFFFDVTKGNRFVEPLTERGTATRSRAASPSANKKIINSTIHRSPREMETFSHSTMY